MPCRAAMRQHDEWQISLGAPTRQGEISRDLHAIGGSIGDTAHRERQYASSVYFADRACSARVQLNQIIEEAVCWAIDLHHKFLNIVRPGYEAQTLALKSVDGAVPALLHLRIKKHVARILARVHAADHAVGAVIFYRCIQQFLSLIHI